jgi:hypothetical protein
MTFEELEREIQRALRSDLARARRLVAQYERRADPAHRAMAVFERAQLAHVLGDHRAAAKAYDAARRGFTKREDLFKAAIGAVQVRALLGEATAVRTEARRLRRLAANPLQRGSAEMAIGSALTSLGDERAAEACFREALRRLRDRPLLRAISRESLALGLARRGAVGEAIREMDAALAFYAAEGLDAAARTARHNRGWAFGVKGDALAALSDLREAQKGFRAAGELRRAAVALSDEAELTLRLGALDRAAAMAREAADALRKEAPLDSARADLLAARALGDRRLATRAQAQLRKAGDEGGVAAAAIVIGRGLDAAERTLLGKGHYLAALDALLARARSTRPRDGARLLKRRAPLYPAVLREWVLPELYYLQGDGRRAFRAAEELRRRAPTGSLRAATLSAHLHIYESLARTLLDRGDASGAFLVLDAMRARTLREELQREAPGAAETPRVAELRARLEALWRSLERRETEGHDLRRAEPILLHDVARCERDLVRALEDAEAPLAATNGSAALPKDPCLAWSVVEGEVIGFLAEKGEVTSWRCGPLARLREDVDALRFQVTRGLHGGSDVGTALAALERLGRALLPPQPPSSRRLCVILAPELGVVPIEAFLDGCTVSYAACASLAGKPQGVRGPMLAIGLDAERLPEVAGEIALVPGADVLVGPTRDEILRAITGKKLVHIAGHAEAREDLPLMSALKVADGWITAADFAGRRLRALFVLSACRTGDPSLLYRGEALGGFPRSLLGAGCSGVVASRWEVRDPVARAWMGYFYEALRREPPDAAVAEAARLVRVRFPHPADWAAFLYLRGVAT